MSDQLKSLLTMLVVFSIGMFIGQQGIIKKHADDLAELEIHRNVRKAQECVGAHEWCRRILDGRIVPVDNQCDE